MLILDYDTIMNIIDFLDDKEVRRIGLMDIDPVINLVTIDRMKRMDIHGYIHPKMGNDSKKDLYKKFKTLPDKTIPFNGRVYIWYAR